MAFGISIPCKGNTITLGFTDGTHNFGFQVVGGGSWPYGMFDTNNYGSDVGTAGGGAFIEQHKTLGITTDPTKSGVVADLSDGQIVVIKY